MLDDSGFHPPNLLLDNGHVITTCPERTSRVLAMCHPMSETRSVVVIPLAVVAPHSPECQERIDVAVAAIMAIGAAMQAPAKALSGPPRCRLQCVIWSAPYFPPGNWALPYQRTHVLTMNAINAMGRENVTYALFAAKRGSGSGHAPRVDSTDVIAPAELVLIIEIRTCRTPWVKPPGLHMLWIRHVTPLTLAGSRHGEKPRDTFFARLCCFASHPRRSVILTPI